MSDLEPSPEESGVEPVPKECERDDRTGRSAAAARIAQQSSWVDLQVRRAMERGEFDDLPGQGKPIEDLGVEHDPDWWVKKLVERENIALLPPAIALRKEDAELDARLDRFGRVDDVREAVEDFNRRVVEARRQLQGGPPVITPLRDVDDEVDRWRARRDARATARRPVDPPQPRRGRGLSLWGRRRGRPRRTP